MCECSYSTARQKKARRSEKHNAQEERNTSTELKMQFFCVREETLGFVPLWQCGHREEGREMTVEK